MGKKRKLWVYIAVAAGIIVLAALLIYKVCEPQENIFFLEYESEYEKEDTVIYRYNSGSKTVDELGRVPGRLQDCVINSEETYITGIIYGEDFEIVRYDLLTGEPERLDAADRIDLLTDAGWSDILIYSGGNKIFASFGVNKNGPGKWLLYDVDTDQYEILDKEDAVRTYLTVWEDKLWYIADGGILYRYDLEKKEKTKIKESVPYDAVIMPDTGLLAYIKKKNGSNKLLYLYNILTGETVCMAGEKWNTVYGDLERTNSRWSDKGNEFFYIKSFMGLFQESTERLMVYNAVTRTSRCIYRERMTMHEFRYVMKR